MADNRANQNNLIEIGQRLYVGTFSYSAATLGQTPLTYVVQQAYPADLNGDGIDEVIFAGFETQPNSADQYTNTKVQIYGWKNGLFQNLTQEWLPGSLSGVEGVGDIAFGDFNGDGKIDVYLSANADMKYSTHEYVLLNSGTYFDRLDLGSSDRPPLSGQDGMLVR